MANGIDSAPISAAIFQRIYTAGNNPKQSAHLMDEIGAGVPERLDVVGEEVNLAAEEGAAGTCPDWLPERRKLAWACPNMDRETLFDNFLKWVNKPLNLLRGWFRA
jgi:hypothetical protein